MAQNQKSYDNEFKAQAVKLAQEIGGHKAANELGIPKGTMYTWIKAFKEGRSAQMRQFIPLRMLYHLTMSLLNSENVLKSRIRKYAA